MVIQRVMVSEYLLFLLNNSFASLSFLSAQPPERYSTSTAVLGLLGLWDIVNRAREALQVALLEAIGQRVTRRLKGTCNEINNVDWQQMTNIWRSTGHNVPNGHRTFPVWKRIPG